MKKKVTKKIKSVKKSQVKAKASKRFTIPVVQLKMNGKRVRGYKSLCAASETTGVNVGSISKAVRGICYSAGGYRWMEV